MSEVATAVVEKTPNSASFAPTGHTPKAAIIRLDRLSKHYTEAGQTQLVLDELNQEFYEGEFVCLLGKSGSGKSTLLNL
ncbi:MAG: ATP-binding cassette domain-containing protein, partial [Caldilineaceae bacterium]|nr:ATP-binding cassette domain-containing protein [Caldilineaceae bacterium]